MAENNSVKFLRGDSESYKSLTEKNENTFYYTTNDKKLYLGSELINGAKGDNGDYSIHPGLYTDANDCIEVGCYAMHYQALNIPMAQWGIIEVTRQNPNSYDANNTWILQRYTDITNSSIYIRSNINGGGWSSWKNLSDADTVDGKHASDFLTTNNPSATGNMQIGVEGYSDCIIIPWMDGVHIRNEIGDGTYSDIHIDNTNQYNFSGMVNGSHYIAATLKSNGELKVNSKVEAPNLIYPQGYFSGNIDTILYPFSGLIIGATGDLPTLSSWGTLLCYSGGTGSCVQIWVSDVDSLMFYRHHDGNGWSSWKKPADGGNADTVDGRHAWDVATLRIDGSTYGSSCDAYIQWDGSYFWLKIHAGYSTAVNYALNADTVDGKHASDFVNVNATTLTTSLHDSITPGTYSCNASQTSDFPSGAGTWGYLNVFAYGAICYQLLMTDASHVLFRSAIVGQIDWSNWRYLDNDSTSSATNADTVDGHHIASGTSSTPSGGAGTIYFQYF